MMVSRRDSVELKQHVAHWWLFFVSLLLAGSLYPFRFRGGTVEQAVAEWATSSDTSKSDLAINFLAGIPVGFLGLLVLVQRKSRPSLTAAACIFVMALSALLSTFVEVSQFWIPTRVSSLYDSLAQVFGAGVGMALAQFCGHWVLDRVKQVRSNARNSVEALLDLYVAGYLVFTLQPFIPAISPTELAAKWKEGGVTAIPFVIWASDPWLAVYTVGVFLSAAIPVGVWLAKRTTGMTLTRAGVTAAICVATLEVAQFAIELRHASADQAIWSAVGAFAGVMLWRRYSKTLDSIISLRGRQILMGATGTFVLLYLSRGLMPFDFVESREMLAARVAKLWASPLGLGGNDFVLGSSLVRLVLWSVMLGALFGLAFYRKHSLPAALFCCTSVVILTTSTEALQLLVESRHPSFLAAGTRLAGGGIGLGLVMRSHLFGFLGDSTDHHSAKTERLGLNGP